MKLSHRDLTTSQQLWLGFGTLTVLLALICLVVIWRLMTFRDAVEDMAEVNRLRTGTAIRLADYLSAYTGAVEEYVAHRDKADRTRAIARANSLDSVLKDFQTAEASGDEATVAEQKVVSGWKLLQQLGSALLDENDSSAELGRFRDKSHALQATLETQLLVAERGAYETRKNAALKGVNTILRFSCMLLTCGLLVAVATSAVVGRSVLADQQQLAIAEERLRTTLAGIGDAVITIDRHGQIAGMNATAETLTGWSSSDAVGQDWQHVVALVDESTGEPIGNPVRTVLKTGRETVSAGSTLLRSREKNEFAVDDRAAPLRSPDGELSGCVLVLRDVTERRRQERVHQERTLLTAIRADVSSALASSMDQQVVLERCCEALRRHLSAISVAVWEQDPSSNRLQLQAKAGANDLVFPQELALSTLTQSLKATLNAGEVSEVLSQEFFAATPGERQASGIVTGFPLFVEGGAFGILSVETETPLDDVLRNGLTPKGEAIAQYLQRKQSEERLRERELRYRLIGQAVNDVIWDWDLVTNQVDWNEGIQTRFGYAAEDVGRNADWWYSGIHPEDQDKVSTSIHGAIENGREDWQDEYRFRRADGSYADVFDRGRVVYRDGKPVRMVGSMLDLTDRKQAEQALRESEERVRLAVESANIGTWNYDLVADRLEWSDRCKATFGLAPDAEISYEVFLERLHPDDRDEVDRLVQASFDPNGDGQYEVDYRVCWPNGTIRWVIARGQCFFAGKGDSREPVRFSGTVLDITERKNIERALQDSEEKFRDLADNISQFAWMADEKGWIFWYNRRWFEYTGTTPEEMQGWGWKAVHHPDHVDRVVEKLQHSWDTGIPWEDTFPLRSREGEYRWFLSRAQPIHDEHGKIVRWFGTNTDIEELKRSEAAARRRSEQVRRLAGVATRLGIATDVASAAGIVTREAYLIVGASTAATELFFDARNPLRVVSPQDELSVGNHGSVVGRPLWESRLVTRVRERNAPIRLNAEELIAQTGQKTKLNGWMAAPLVDRQGKNLGVLQLVDKQEGEFTNDDEAVLVQLAQMASVAIENTRLLESLQENDRRKDEFLATLAHELRNPLAPIRTGLEVLRLSENDTATLDEVRGVMERQTRQLVALVDDLLDVSRITRGKLELRRCPVLLSEVARNAVEAARPLIDDAGHTLTLSIPEEPIELYADPHRLAQVLSNLLNNAAKYTPEGGRIEFGAHREEGEAVLSVRDTGVGIPADKRSQIFEMFAQIDRPLEKLSTGLGIGLTLVKSLVEMHGGIVQVFSEGADRGSEFVVRLPISEPVQPELDQSSDPGKSLSRKSRKVLIVDDNRAAAEMLAMIIQILGNEVQTAHDGEEGVAAAESFRPEVILMDLGMPIMTGYEATRHIRAQPWGKEIVIIALTGWGQEEDKLRTREAGFDHHLVKPAEPSELQSLLANLP